MSTIKLSLSEKIRIQNKLGLHVRAAAKFINAISEYDADIQIIYNDKTINGKSIMQVMGLAATCGAEMEIVTTGTEAKQCLVAAVKIINDKFGED